MNPAYLRPLADHLWQSSAFAGAVWLLTLALRKNGARLRHWLWLTASCKFLVPLSVLIALGGHIEWRTAPLKTPAGLPAAIQQVARPFTSSQVSAPLPPPASPVQSRFPAVLAALWAIGFTAIGLSWWIRWLRILTTVRSGSPVPLAIPIPAKSSPDLLEPSVFGVFRPVLLLPQGILERLTPGELQALVAHELCHVRYRDNLAASIQMFIENVFWFHPLVWWIGKRMVDERERACDEEVLARGNNPESYVEAILKVCRLCLESPLPCASGIGGSGLRRRIADILRPPVLYRLHPTKKFALAAFAFAAVAGPLAIGIIQAPSVRAQERTPAPVSFDVASIKPFQGFPSNPAVQRSGGRIRWTAAVKWMVMYAYRVQAFQVSGAVPANFYAIDAETSPDATDDQVRLMFQSLLAGRFKFQAHRETRQMSGYALVPAKGGIKVEAAAPDDPPAPWPKWFPKVSEGKSKAFEGQILAGPEGVGITAITARRVTMAQFVDILEDQILHTSVVDRTGLTGKYYFGCVFRAMPISVPN